MNEGLRGYEFQCYLKKIPFVSKYYKTVCSINEIPINIKVREFIIVNLSLSHEPGTHWIVIIRSHRQLYEVFNSLGFENLNELTNFFKIRTQAEIVYNETGMQLKDSSTCGLFCIYFIVHRVLNYDLSFFHLLNDIFFEDLTLNENKVVEFCSRLKNASDDSDLFDD